MGFRSISLRLCLFVLALMASHSATATPPPPHIPVDAFFADPKFSHPRLSPDGEHLAMLYSDGETQRVAVRPTLGGKIELIFKISEPKIRLAWLEWANSDRLLVSVQSRNYRSVGVRGRRHRLYAIDRDGSKPVFLGKKWPDRIQHQDQILHWLPDDPDHVLIQYNNPTNEFPGVVKMDIRTGELELGMKSRADVHLWRADHQGNVRAGIGFKGLHYMLFTQVIGKGYFEKIQDYNLYKNEGLRFVDFSHEPTKIYVLKGSAIHEYDLATKALGKMIFDHPIYEPEGLVFDHERRKLVAVRYIEHQPKLHFLDEQARLEQEAVDRALPGTVNEIVSRSLGGNRAIVKLSSDTHPPEYFLFIRDTQPKSLEPLLNLYPNVPAERLATMKPVSFTARDGLEIPAYLTLPKGLEPKNLPVVVYPHGGPTARDVRGFDPTVQLLANRGFAIFQVNFRGSSGYGDAFTRLGYQQWGLAMQDDLTDGTKWLIDQGIADPRRIGIYGASYGGYAALMGLVKTPRLYRAGASYAGVTDLPKLLSDGRYYLGHEHNRPQIGGQLDWAKLRRNSPVHRAKEIQAPVLLAHGEDDSRVHVKHSKEMKDALRDKDKEVEFLKFKHEVHGFLFAENRIHFHERLVRFFEEHLGSR